MSSNKQFPVDYSKEIDVCKRLRAAFEDVKHYQSWSNRIKAKFQAALPEYTIALGAGECAGALNTLRIWGNGFDYNNRCVYLCWNTGQQPWQAGFLEALDIADPSDYQEWQESEKEELDALSAIERQIIALRQEADNRIKRLPIPKSATVRKNECHWQSPSGVLKAMFPNIWGQR
jgi:hypothetical protein